MWGGVMVTVTLICNLPFYTLSLFILTDAVKRWAFHPFFAVFLVVVCLVFCMWLIIMNMIFGGIFLEFFLKISTLLLGDLRGNYVRTKEIPDNTYPVRLEFELNDYTALSSPVIYGLDAPRGKAFTHEKFIEYCKNHQVGEEDSDEPDLFS